MINRRAAELSLLHLQDYDTAYSRPYEVAQEQRRGYILGGICAVTIVPAGRPRVECYGTPLKISHARAESPSSLQAP